MDRKHMLGFGLGAICALGVVACGSSSKGSGSALTTVASSTTTVKSNQNIAADQASAEGASLKLSDFPTGWTSQPPSDNTTGQGIKSDLARCLGVPETSLIKPPVSYDSPDFSSSENESASSSVGYRATGADQKAALALFTGPKVPSCMTTAVSQIIAEEIKHPSSPDNTLPSGAKVGTTTVSPMSFPLIGDACTAYQVKVPISYQGLDLNLYVDEVLSIKGRASVDMSFIGLMQPFPADQEEHYTELVVNRLTNTADT